MKKTNTPAENADEMLAELEWSEEEQNTEREPLPNRLRILCLYSVLYKYTDDEHGLTREEIEKKLQDEYGITADRKVFYKDIKALEQFGVKIESTRGALGSYRLLHRFEVAELTVLADAVIGSHFFTPKQAKKTIKKLQALCSANDADSIKPGKVVSDIDPKLNEGVFYRVHDIHSAIVKKRKIKFEYINYDYDPKSGDFVKQTRGEKICSPIALAWSDGKYYLIAYYEKYAKNGGNGISHFRVDKIVSSDVLNEPAEKLPKDFDLSEYMKGTFSMFSGVPRDVDFEFDNTLVNPVMDKFGKFKPTFVGSNFKVTLPVRMDPQNMPPTFFSWLFQFGDKARIKAPEDVRDKYKSMLQSVLLSVFSDDIELREVTLRVDKKALGGIENMFGEISPEPDGEDRFIVKVTVKTDPKDPMPFFNWLFGFGGKVRIKEPEDLRRRFIKTLNDIIAASEEE